MKMTMMMTIMETKRKMRTMTPKKKLQLRMMHSSIVDSKCVCAASSAFSGKQHCNNSLHGNANKSKKKAVNSWHKQRVELVH